MSALGYVIKLTSVLDDFGDAACLRSLQRQGFRGPQTHVGPAGNKGKEILMSSTTVSLRVRMLAAAAAVLALLAGGVAATTATDTSGDAGRGLAGRGL